MIEIPAWVIWGLIVTPFLSGVGIITYLSKYLSKNEYYRDKRVCQNMQDIRFKELYDNRKEVWTKIDEIHDKIATVKDDTGKIRVEIANLSGRIK